MATTPVFAEILTIGLQVEAWLVVLVFTLFGTDWVDVAALSDFAALVVLLVAALAYVLGVVVDRLADTLLDAFENRRLGKWLKTRMSKDGKVPEVDGLSRIRMRVLHKSDGMSRFLDYQRSRWRIARATVLNLAIAGPLTTLYIARTDQPWAWSLLPAVSALILVPLTYYAGIRIQNAWVRRLVQAAEILDREADK